MGKNYKRRAQYAHEQRVEHYGELLEGKKIDFQTYKKGLKREEHLYHKFEDEPKEYLKLIDEEGKPPFRITKKKVEVKGGKLGRRAKADITMTLEARDTGKEGKKKLTDMIAKLKELEFAAAVFAIAAGLGISLLSFEAAGITGYSVLTGNTLQIGNSIIIGMFLLVGGLVTLFFVLHKD